MTAAELFAIAAQHRALCALAGAALCLALTAVVLARPRRRFLPRPILTPNELEFWHRLARALPEHTILAQVAMSALLTPAATRNHRRYMQIRSQFSGKYVDYVVCDPETLDVTAIIELDDRMHDPSSDAIRDAMLNEAGYTVVRWDSRRKPSVSEISETLKNVKR